jgi:hypothetical protein
MNSADLFEISGIAPGLWPSVPWHPAHEALSISPWVIFPAWPGEASSSPTMITAAVSSILFDVCIAKLLSVWSITRVCQFFSPCRRTIKSLAEL